MSVMTMIGLGAIEGILLAGTLWNKIRKGTKGLKEGLATLEEHLAEKTAQATRLTELHDQLIDFDSLRAQVIDLKRLREGLKVEKGRVTITQAELETVEGRLRELEEIERELGASSIETKEELKILKRKEKELLSKNDALKTQLEGATEQLQTLFTEIEINAQLEAEVDKVKAEMLACQAQIDIILLQIEMGNDQYLIVKQRYDALDIEYAQLYEKFAESAPPG